MIPLNNNCFIQSDGWLYSRWNNPTTDAASQTLNNLEGGYGTLLFSSGMAAVSTAFMAMLKSGDHVVRIYTLIERFLYDPEKWWSIRFISPWMKRSKHGLFVFPLKKTLISRRHCSIGQSCCGMMPKWCINWFLESSWAWRFFTRVFA